MLNHDIKEANKKKNCPDCLGHHLFNLMAEGEFIIRYQEWLNHLWDNKPKKWRSKIDCAKTYYDFSKENVIAPLHTPDEDDFDSFYDLLGQYIGHIKSKYDEGQIALDKLDLSLMRAVMEKVRDRDYIPKQWFLTFVRTLLFPYAFDMTLKSFFTYWKLVRQVRVEYHLLDDTEDLYDKYIAQITSHSHDEGGLV